MFKEIVLEQGSQEWHEYRRTKIGASDSNIIMGYGFNKTPYKLWAEKQKLLEPDPMNENMRRGHLLEPQARDLINSMFNQDFKPIVLESIHKTWLFASYDGISSDGTILEIKCPRNGHHKKIPDYYMPQLQHQMYVAEAKKSYYVTYHDQTLNVLEAKLCENFVDTMLEKNQKFYEYLVNFEPPPLTEKDYVNLEENTEWVKQAEIWRHSLERRKHYETMEEEARKKLISMSGQHNSKGCGVKVLRTIRKGNVNYDRIPELNFVDKEKYRNPNIEMWRVTNEFLKE